MKYKLLALLHFLLPLQLACFGSGYTQDEFKVEGMIYTFYSFTQDQSRGLHITGGFPQYLEQYPDWFAAFLALKYPRNFKSYDEWISHISDRDREMYPSYGKQGYEVGKNNPEAFEFYNEDIFIKYAVKVKNSLSEDLAYLVVVHSIAEIDQNNINEWVVTNRKLFTMDGTSYKSLIIEGPSWLDKLTYRTVERFYTGLQDNPAFGLTVDDVDFSIHSPHSLRKPTNEVSPSREDLGESLQSTIPDVSGTMNGVEEEK